MGASVPLVQESSGDSRPRLLGGAALRFSDGDQYRSSLAQRPKGTVSSRFPVLHERDARAHMGQKESP